MDLMETVAGFSWVKVLTIARDATRTVDERMRLICRLDGRFLDMVSPRWAQLLGCSDAAVRRCQFWTADRHRRLAGG